MACVFCLDGFCRFGEAEPQSQCCNADPPVFSESQTLLQDFLYSEPYRICCSRRDGEATSIFVEFECLRFGCSERLTINHINVERKDKKRNLNGV